MKKIILTLLFGLISLLSFSQDSYFLKVTSPGVVGTSTNANHLNEIPIKDFDFAILNKVNIGSISSGGGAGKARSGPITLEFKAFKDATKFFLHLHNGDSFGEFIISAQKPSGATTFFDYLTYTFKSVLVSNFSSYYKDGETDITYKLVVKAGTMKVKYTPTNVSGGPDTSDAVEKKWSFIKNNASEDVN